MTDFQKTLLTSLKPNRNPNSYIAGAMAIHRSSTSGRYSNDVDFFHDLDEAVASAYQTDVEILGKLGYDVKVTISQPSFIRVVVSKGSNSLKLEWVRDTAFRFYPVVEDPDLGYRLHDVDLTINKVLALANRTEVRDIIDLIQLDKTTLSLSAACWAACGKDPGFTPDLLYDCMQRNSIIRPEQLDAENLVVSRSATDLKREWLTLLERSKQESGKAPAADLGCVYLDKNNEVVKAPFSAEFKEWKKHFGSIGGSWPRLV